ncbi:conjugal transfer protein TrbE [Caulobacter sp. CCNWLY153]|uniref:Conjugal transfer protein TrbE n=1 Tax=Caulobacter radicis TaxID=2172650 RepID=A0A2T9IVT7_9CAUL|nr:conjugal transfer protein TrbE [Caulobacter radicis]PVM70899.1 conjugal transfer protein TrbE [Caulobacter radicis]
MLFLGEYRGKSSRLFDHLPWALLIAPGVVLNKDGAFQQTLAFRGPDLASATDIGLVAARAQVNNALRRLGSRWCVHAEAVRRPSRAYPAAAYPDPVSHLIDEERRAEFEAEGVHFESRYFLTLTFLPPEDAVGAARSLLVENLPDGKGSAALYRAALDEFRAAVASLRDILASVLPMVVPLDDAATLAYLHACVSTKDHPIAPPPAPAYLDAFLTDDDLQGGLYPRLGGHYLRTLSVRAYPAASWPGILDQLNGLGLAYRWVTRFLPLDKEDARKAVTTLRKRWFAKRKGILALLKEAITKEPSVLEDPDAAQKAQDADAALAVLGDDLAALGYVTPTITLTHPDPDVLAAQVRQVESVVNRAGFVAKVEDLNAVEAWLGSLPGQAYADQRRPLVSTLNLCDLLPVSAIWPGPDHNAHLSAECAKRGFEGPQPPLMHALTGSTTPFRLDLFQGDVGHAFVGGPTGAGKSVLLLTMALQWLGYPQAQVRLIDKGASARAATLLVGGAFHDLGGGAGLAFQPLADIDDPDERTWAQGWVEDLLVSSGMTLDPAVREAVWTALQSLAAAPRSQRTLTLLAATLQDRALKAALAPFTLAGPYGRLLDAADVDLARADWQTFEMGELIASHAAAGPVLTCLFHRLARDFDGRPTLLVLDEAWLLLESTAFAGKIREWLLTLRKKNVAVIFTTPSLKTTLASPIAGALLEACPTRIFLPNPDARTPDLAKAYAAFGLNAQQVSIIAEASAKREYYYQSPAGDRLFELGLGPVALAAVGSASPGDQDLMTKLLAEHGQGGFAPAFYRAKGLPEVAEFLAQARHAA